ncbi:MAG: 5-formyltetrahydrofolate cyclo-ligase [Clostridium sp.]
MDKKNIRKNILSLRARVKNGNDKNQKILNRLIETEEIKKSRNIFVYISFGHEIDTREFIKWCFDNEKQVYVPKITEEKGTMEAIKITSLDELKENKLGILEPIDGKQIKNINDIDVVILPGAAFDLKGGRIGYGGGYYDRYLKGYSNCKISLTYEIQILNEIPMEEHDISYDILISEKNIYKV